MKKKLTKLTAFIIATVLCINISVIPAFATAFQAMPDPVMETEAETVSDDDIWAFYAALLEAEAATEDEIEVDDEVVVATTTRNLLEETEAETKAESKNKVETESESKTEAETEDKAESETKSAATEKEEETSGAKDEKETSTANEADEDSITTKEKDSLYGVTVGEDGSRTYSFGDWEWTFGEEETTDTVTGIVNVRTHLNLRSGAGMNYEIIGKLSPGAEVEVIGQDGDWYHVTVPEQSGYVYSQYVDLIKKAEETGNSGSSGDSMDETLLAMLLYMMMLTEGATAAPETPEPAGTGLTPNGNLTLVDDIGSSTAAGQQFITVVTKNGNYFYLIIDRDDDGDENVHFLNLVDERDLLDLMDDEEVAEYNAAAVALEEAVAALKDAEGTSAEDVPIEETAESEEKKSSGGSALPLLIVAIVAGGGVGYFFLKKRKNKEEVQKQKPDPDADYGEEDETAEEDDDAYDFPEDEDVENDEILDEVDDEIETAEEDSKDDEKD